MAIHEVFIPIRNQREVARLMGLSQQRIGQIERKAWRKIKIRMRKP